MAAAERSVARQKKYDRRMERTGNAEGTAVSWHAQTASGIE